MFLTVHSSTGAFVGNTAGNPLLAFIIGMISHFLLDSIPHFDPSGSEDFDSKKITLTKKGRRYLLVVICDILLAGVFLLFLLSRKPVYPLGVIFGVIGSVLPDFLMGLYKLTKNPILKIYNTFHQNIHFDQKKIHVNFFLGNLTQLAAFILPMILLQNSL